MFRQWLWLSTLFIGLSGVNAFAAEKVHVAVASNFIATMKLLSTAYQRHSDDKLLVSYGSSGKLYAQILRGAPFEVFLSADQQKPISLEQKGMVIPGSRFTYGIGILVLWSADNTLLTGKPDWQQMTFNKLVIANPRTAPYGIAARQVLENQGVYEGLQQKLVQGENIAQTFIFVKTGNAQLGLIALAQVLQLSDNEKGSAWQVPSDLHSPITQDAVLLQNASDAAKRFYQFLQSPAAQSIISASGYNLINTGQQLQEQHDSE